MRIILVADHAAIEFGGEAALPCHYFRVLLSRKFDVHLVVHERSKEFLEKPFKEAAHRIHYIKDTRLQLFYDIFLRNLPDRFGYMTFGYLIRTSTNRQQKKRIGDMISDGQKTVVHQVIPVSPRTPSYMVGFGVPVMIGPLNGNITYPEAFSHYEGRFSHWLNNFSSRLSGVANKLVSGKLQADMILVANSRTQQALPNGRQGQVKTLVENGIDLSVWKDDKPVQKQAHPSFIYVGRLVDWKAVDILLEAFILARKAVGEMKLHIVGDGRERKKLEAIAAEDQGAKGWVVFHGWLQQSDIAPILSSSNALVLSSLQECGGAVVLEAMASSTAVVATNWGGPADYLDSRCGILIDPISKPALVDGFAEAMIMLAKQPEFAQKMGEFGRKKVEMEYDWERKIDDVVSLYESLLDSPSHKV